MNTPRQLPAWTGWAVFLAALGVTFGLGLLAISIMERRREAMVPPRITVPIPTQSPDSALWGKNFPQEYQGWLATAEGGAPTKYGGPTPFSWLERDPLLSKLWQGYPFAIDYNEERGHRMAVEDVTHTRRVDPTRGGAKQPGTCWTCKSSQVPQMMEQYGIAGFYKRPFDSYRGKITHPIGCADCHDSQTMQLRISRPALREAFQAMGRDIDKVSHQEMRSLVCAQCHVEYYFAKRPDAEKGYYLTFPWKRGTRIEQIEKYYTEDVPHVDWVHPVSQTPMIKMQHPDYEIYLTGVHAYRDVACADCHMPYMSVGGIKYTDHHIQSPLKNIENSCLVCHRWTAEEVRKRVESIQDNNQELQHTAESALVSAHEDIAAAMARKTPQPVLDKARGLLRRAQMRWDFVAQNSGMGIHSPQECARILATAIDLAHQARLTARSQPE